MNKPHSIIGIPEAERVLRLLGCSGPEAQAALNGIAASLGVATPRDDAAAVRGRLRRHAEDAIRWHGAAAPK